MPKQDTIFIREIKIDATIGVHEWERTIKQAVIVDLELNCDLSAAALQDQLELTIDYKHVCDAVISLVTNSKFYLLESLASAIAKLLLEDPKLDSVKVSVQKPNALPQATTVGVCIERSK